MSQKSRGDMTCFVCLNTAHEYTVTYLNLPQYFSWLYNGETLKLSLKIILRAKLILELILE